MRKIRKIFSTNKFLPSVVLGAALLGVAVFGSAQSNFASSAAANGYGGSGYGGSRIGYFTHVTPNSYDVLPGGSVSFTGVGFGAFETVSINSPGDPTRTVTSDGGGNISTPPYPVGYNGGNKPYTFTGNSSGATDTVNIAVRNQDPWIYLIPYYSAAGTTLTVQGHQFGLNEPVDVTFEGVNKGTPTANGSGEFNTSFLIPAGSSGQKTVGAIGQLTHKGDTEPFSQAQ